MRLALRELFRRPGRFAIAGAALTLIAVLQLLLGGLLDGLTLGSTALYRRQSSELLVFSDDSRASIIRSRIDADERAAIEAVEGVEAVHGLGIALVGLRVPGESELADAAVVGYEGALSGVPRPPGPRQGYADRRLAASGVSVGDVVEVGPGRVPVSVVGWVEEISYLLQPGLLVDVATWREVLTTSRPSAALPEGTVQVLAVEVTGDAAPEAVADRIDAATGSSTSTLGIEAAIGALPGIKEQRSTFNQITGVTYFVAGLVVALFFAFVTIERTAQFGVLKAIGASSRQILAGLVVQAVTVTAGAVALGLLATLGLSRVIPPEVPLDLQQHRAVTVAAGMLATALIGGAISLRRVARIDPASAIG